jgi:hypothetical protein
MPKGCRRPLAKTLVSLALPSGPMPRNTRTRSALLSATNRSPLGAVRIRRGFSSLSANSSTLKPAGALGQASFGLSITLRPLSVDSVAFGGGRSLARMWWTAPGVWLRKSVKGLALAFPVPPRPPP